MRTNKICGRVPFSLHFVTIVSCLRKMRGQRQRFFMVLQDPSHLDINLSLVPLYVR